MSQPTVSLAHTAGPVGAATWSHPLSLRRLVYVDGQQAVIYRGLRANPGLGGNFVAMDLWNGWLG